MQEKIENLIVEIDKSSTRILADMLKKRNGKEQILTKYELKFILINISS